MPNLRQKTWTTTTPANVEDAQFWEDHLLGDSGAPKTVGTLTLVDGEGTELGVFDGSEDIEVTVGSGSGSGHVIEDADGDEMAQRPNLQFLNAEVTDDEINGKTIIDCQGEKGDPGEQGEPGFSPTANVVKSGDTATITITDEDGTTTASVSDGEDGTSLTATSTKVGKVTTVLIKNAETEEVLTTLTINDGEDGSGGGGDMRKAVYDTDNDGVVDSAETLDGLTASITELNYVDGVTSSIQDQLNLKIDDPMKGFPPVVLINDNLLCYDVSEQKWTMIEKDSIKSEILVELQTNFVGPIDSTYFQKAYSFGFQRLTLSDDAKEKYDNFDISGSLTTALGNKADADDLDEWSTEVTLASGNTFTFTGLNNNYSYKLFCDNPKAYISDVTQTGTTVVYTMGGDGLLVGTTKGKLRVIK